MKRTGKLAVVLCLVFLLGAFGQGVVAQPSASVEATVSHTTVYTGERISLSIEVSGDFNNVSRPQLPQFDGFRLLSNNPSTSRSYSFINGRTNSSYTYTYYLIAQSTGEYQIPPISISVDGQEHSTQSISVRIIDRNTAVADPDAQTRPDIFLELDISDKQPVTGQQLLVDVVLFFKDGLEVNSYQPIPGWKAEGFWKEELENSTRPRAESVVLNGIRYRKARLLRFALFPTKSGELTISPYQVVVSVRSSSARTDPFSSFFGGFGTNQRQIELKSDPVNVTVHPLPEISEARYVGAVGSFDISRRVSVQKALVGESIEIVTAIRGTGNIPLVSKPGYDLPEGLEVYVPQENSSINRRNGRISGSKVFTDIVIARTPGTFTIPEVELAYFDPARERYVTETLPAHTFVVERDPNAVAVSEESMLFSVTPITGLANWIVPHTPELWSHWWFWAGLVIPLLVLGVGYWKKSYRERMSTDTTFARSQRAQEVAAERLERAIHLADQREVKNAYNTLQKALTGFIGDRLGLPEAGLSNQEYVAALDKKGVDPDLVKNVRLLLDKCATISYAPNTSPDYLKSHVGLARSILDKLKKVL